MDSPGFKDTVCRICLDENVTLHWDSKLEEHADVTYKDCYYKYTELQCLDDDPFSSMLCPTCSNDLQNVHSLVLKAHDSYNFLLDVNCSNSKIVNVKVEENITTTLKAVRMEESDTDSNGHVRYKCESSDGEEVINGNQNDSEEMYTIDSITIEPYNEELDEDNSEDSVLQPSNVVSRSNSKEEMDTKATINTKKLKQDSKNTNRVRKKSIKDENKSKNRRNSNMTKKRKAVVNKQNINIACPICFKVLRNKYGLEKHQKTHLENRERKVTCPICNLKFFEKFQLREHMRIHDENREKSYKCDDCDKAFYNFGDLNIHRRIHLGQMKICPMCEKEFFRQVDLERHMNIHSENSNNSRTSKRSRYYVRCKHCDKNILSTNFKSHTAAHLNKPLMKCSICDKEFFNRTRCVIHMKNIHKQTSDEYNEFIVIYNKNRLSHLYLEQTAEIQIPEAK